MTIQRKIDGIRDVTRKHRRDTGDYPEDVKLVYELAGDTYHDICDLQDIDRDEAIRFMNHYNLIVERFIYVMEEMQKDVQRILNRRNE